MPSETPIVRVSPTSKAALVAAQQRLTAATGRPAVLGALVDEVLAAYLQTYLEARLAVLQPGAVAGAVAATDGGR